MRRYFAAVAILLCLFSYPQGVKGQGSSVRDSPLIQARFSVEMDLVPSLRSEKLPAVVPESVASEKEAAKVRGETAVRALLEEARWVFGGMVYGFDFSYTPSDIAKKVNESFDLVPRSEVRWGDSGLSILETRLEGTVLSAIIAYKPGPDGAALFRSWASTALGSSYGRGSAPLDGAFEARREAAKLAVKSAIREYFRVLTKNKPKACRGSCVFSAVPSWASTSGGWTASVRIRVDADEIVPYSVF